MRWIAVIGAVLAACVASPAPRLDSPKIVGELAVDCIRDPHCRVVAANCDPVAERTERPRAVCVCDECESDADCPGEPAGRCVGVDGAICGTAHRHRCVFPGQACFEPCEAGLLCVEQKTG